MNRILVIGVACVLMNGHCAVTQSEPVAKTNVDSHETIAKMGQGFIIWESNRSGAWRLWRIGLDGKGLKQISPDEPSRDHYCPHISPNGRKVVYLSYPKEQTGYEPYNSKKPAPMHIMNTDGTGDRVILPSARAYSEDRAVVWVDDDTFHYIDGEGISSEYRLSTSRSIALSKQTYTGSGWIVNAQKSFAITGSPNFSRYNPTTQTINVGKELDGCQPYFSADGKWGFWMGGAAVLLTAAIWLSGMCQ